MDYSGIPSDTENPAGPSPWGSSSPKANRTSFPSSETTDVPPPPSPLPAAQQSPYGVEPSGGQGQQYPQVQTSVAQGKRPEHDSSPEDDLRSPDDLSSRLQSAQLGDPDYDEVQPHYYQPSPYAQQQQQQHHQQQQQQQQRTGPARYQTGARHAQRQQVPQYKLQAKITALERTGRKDPVLRFDVHVHVVSFMLDRPY